MVQAPLSQEEILKIFKEKEVLLEGHFKLTSGRHAAYYMQCAKLLQYPEVAGPLLEQLASYFKDQNVTVVAGPGPGRKERFFRTGKRADVLPPRL